MNILRSGASIPRILRSSHPQSLPRIRGSIPPVTSRGFHAGSALLGIRSQILKDVGEGITEVQIIQWYVEEGAHIEEWKPLFQYQSDKAVDDITSRYEGVIKKLHFEADDTVPTGSALVEIEVDDAKYPDDNPHPASAAEPEPVRRDDAVEVSTNTPALESSQAEAPALQASEVPTEAPKSKYASLATPAVRGLLKTHGVDILHVNGTGKDGRVMKEDVLKFVQKRDSPTGALSTTPSAPSSITPDTRQSETVTNLTPVQSSMFKTMTKSLNIPHFLYADELKTSNVTAIRKKLSSDSRDPKKITFLPFVVKAVSLALNDFPLLNAKVDTSTDQPKLIMRSKHNIGIAMDTPNGLVVPNIKDVASLSILDIAAEVTRLSALGKQGKLTSADMSGGTITVSNIGNIGGTYVAPVLVPTEVAILGIGRTRVLPVFDEDGQVAKGELVNFSWSADHRVVDGATMARMGNRVRELIEAPELMLLNLR
ncbi:hypothetical protein PENDEC_c021G04518 [Penicillium decumbens]|uniref:Dihydrolipoamide acetyltransferase component of pyruvate dehydrogenase complex n=1 Tax=Penicillium decumbens TaxID=69771 RepID=A0A1V6P7C0_PENDC|nr:hypothetical protein PENDEC_c021G04518 [Penicillium decumbens]